MEEYSVLLGKFWGFYMVIVGFAYFMKRERMQYILDEFYENAALLLVTAIIPLFIGLWILLTHNVWTFDWRVIITILGVMSLLKGILLLYTPNFVMQLSKAIVTPIGMAAASLTSLVLGGILLCGAFGWF